MMTAWPHSRALAAIEALALSSGLRAPDTDRPGAPPPFPGGSDWDWWVASTAAWLGLEAEPVELPYRGFAGFLRTAGPALIRLRDGRLIALDAMSRVIGPDLSAQPASAEELRGNVFRAQEARAREDADRLLNTCALSPGRREVVRRGIVGECLQHAREAGTCWQLRLPPGGSFWSHCRTAGLPRRLTYLASAHAAEYVVWIGAWAMVGQGALKGYLDQGWLFGWALLLMTLIPLRLGVTWLQGQIAIRAGGLLKERMLYGALRLEPDHMRRQGAGQLLGCVIETEAMESLALGGGFLALVSGIELIAAAVIAAWGAGSTLIPVLLVGWMLVSGALLWRYVARCSRWTTERLAMTDDLVERMVGHRTRLAQEPRARWHEREDLSLEAYEEVSEKMDRSAPWLTAFIPRGWLAAGIAGLAPAFVAGSLSTERLAIALGAILLAFRAFRKLGAGAPLLVQAFIASALAQPLLHAAGLTKPRSSPALPCAADKPREGEILVEARDVTFRYHDRPESVLRGCTFQIRAGDRILLDGPSGGGKSTLAAILASVHKPTSGLVLAGGFDRASLGEQGWRRRVAAAPQFHENHLITGPLAFNLLMGRNTITDEDIQEAEAVCDELGLRDLLQRMPAGIMQLVGESGWQLSHGERSRVYMARALLQKADLLVLDEGFAALDSANLTRAAACLEKRATSVLAIAHR